MRKAKELRLVYQASDACGDISEAEESLARNMVTARQSHDGRNAMSEEDKHQARAGKPLDPPNLTIIQEGIALVDQEVEAVVPRWSLQVTATRPLNMTR